MNYSRVGECSDPGNAARHGTDHAEGSGSGAATDDHATDTAGAERRVEHALIPEDDIPSAGEEGGQLADDVPDVANQVEDVPLEQLVEAALLAQRVEEGLGERVA